MVKGVVMSSNGCKKGLGYGTRSHDSQYCLYKLTWAGFAHLTANQHY